MNKEGNFVVRESVGLNFIYAAFFLAVFISLIVNFSNSYTSEDKWLSIFVGLIVLVAAIFFTMKGLKRKECIRINSEGFFYYNSYITGWENLESVELSQEEKVVTLQDNFVLIFKYSKERNGDLYTRKIALTNTQNKSEEEILAAIKFYIDAAKNS